MAHRVSSADILRLIIFRPRLLLSFRVLYGPVCGLLLFVKPLTSPRCRHDRFFLRL